MAWKDWPRWVKILGVISLVMIILLEVGTVIVFLKPTRDFPSSMGMLILIILMIYYFLVIVGMWGLGFLIKYLVKRKLYWIANTISVAGLVISSIWLLKWMWMGIKSPYPPFFQFLFSVVVLYGWLIIAVIYFIIALILINNQDSKN